MFLVVMSLQDGKADRKGVLKPYQVGGEHRDVPANVSMRWSTQRMSYIPPYSFLAEIEEHPS